MKMMSALVVTFAAGMAAVPVHHAAAATYLQSSASTVSGLLTVNGTGIPISGGASASGNTARGPYSATTSIPSLSQSIYAPSSNSVIGVTVAATNLAASVSGTSVDPAFAQAATGFDQVGISVVPPATGAAAYLTVAVTGAQGMSTYVPGGSSQGTAYGSTSLGSVVISGSILNGRTFTAPLNAPANTVVYQKHGIKVTLNAQLAVSPTGCGSNCASLPQGLETDGVRVDVSNVSVDGKTVSGHFEIGKTVSN